MLHEVLSNTSAKGFLRSLPLAFERAWCIFAAGHLSYFCKSNTLDLHPNIGKPEFFVLNKAIFCDFYHAFHHIFSSVARKPKSFMGSDLRAASSRIHAEVYLG